MRTADVIEHYETVLSGFGHVVDFDISALDRLDVAVTSTSLIVDGRFAAQANGYAVTTEQARVGGLGELAEGVLMRRAVTDLIATDARRGSRRELLRAEADDRVVDPRRLGLPAGSSYDDDQQLVWLPMRRVRTDETVYVPADFVVSEPGELTGSTPLIPPVTNGLGAGLDQTRAVTHGLLEILQRHTNGLRFRALDRLSPQIEESGLPPAVRELADRMRAAGVFPVFKHAGTELGVCSTYVVGTDDDPTDPIRLSACGEAAHPSAEVSLTKALLEFANSRARKAFFFGRQPGVTGLGPAAYWSAVRAGAADLGEPRARQAMLHWAALPPDRFRDLVAPHRDRTVSFDDLGGPGAQLDQQSDVLDHLLRALDGAEADHDVLALTSTVDGVTAAKVLVTDLEVEILSYGRIGESGTRHSLETGLDLVRIQPDPTATHPDRVRLYGAADVRLGGPVYYSYDVADAIVGPLYPLYREPPRHSVTV